MTNPANPLPTIHFDLPPGGAPAPVTWQEEELLSQYGKVFFYFCEAIDPVTNMVVWSKYMMPDSSYPTAPPGHWSGTGVSVNIPGVVPIVPLVYNEFPISTASQELILNIGSVFPPPPPPPLPSFPQYASYYEFPYKGVTIFVKVTTDANKMYVEIDNL